MSILRKLLICNCTYRKEGQPSRDDDKAETPAGTMSTSAEISTTMNPP